MTTEHDEEFGPHEDCVWCKDDLTEEEFDKYFKTLEPVEVRPMPPVDEYGICTGCRRRRGTGCACGMTFAEKIKTIALDEEALRIFNMGGKGRKRGKDHADNKRGA